MSAEDEGIEEGESAQPPALTATVPPRPRRPALPLAGDLAVLVEVRSEAGLQFGFVRSLGDNGCVIELETPPRLGSSLHLRFAGIEGSLDAPEGRELEGYAQHAMLWRLGPTRRRVRRVAVKWAPAPQLS